MASAVRLEEFFPVSAGRLWNALTTISEMKQWYFPMLQEFRTEPAFETVFTVHNNGQDYPHRWKVIEAIPNKTLSYSWSFDGYPGTSVLRFDIESDPNGSSLVLTHSGLDSFQPDKYPQLSSDNFAAGWKQIIGSSLKKYLEQQPPGPESL